MKVFVIDDDHLSVFLTQSILNLDTATTEVVTFLSAEAALETMAELDNTAMPDVIFLDLNMPLMDGWHFLDALAKLKPGVETNCSIYVLTSSLDVSDSIKAAAYSMVSRLLHKPITNEDISLIYEHIAAKKKAAPKRQDSYVAPT
ncbi:CheY-like chemotaxis protein [Pontibacter aydingkolensis]|uniref:Response regulator n=1 Tax=Pontibacter aydingkolensis TaxID=1911536 RepID=A0ABS7CWK4_9BACT|nr:response regulator [Pontibacter aydingkolensis]MBW7468076.1 response regulator [Pontibacter aydingkolensis]